MAVGRLLSRASSTRAVDRDGRRAGAALGAEKHVGRRTAAARRVRGIMRVAVRRTAPWNDSPSSATPARRRDPGKNSFAPARIA